MVLGPWWSITTLDILVLGPECTQSNVVLGSQLSKTRLDMLDLGPESTTIHRGPRTIVVKY